MTNEKSLCLYVTARTNAGDYTFCGEPATVTYKGTSYCWAHGCDLVVDKLAKRGRANPEQP